MNKFKVNDTVYTLHTNYEKGKIIEYKEHKVLAITPNHEYELTDSDKPVHDYYVFSEDYFNQTILPNLNIHNNFLIDRYQKDLDILFAIKNEIVRVNKYLNTVMASYAENIDTQPHSYTESTSDKFYRIKTVEFYNGLLNKFILNKKESIIRKNKENIEDAVSSNLKTLERVDKDIENLKTLLNELDEPLTMSL